jgi:hypothetical protein
VFFDEHSQGLRGSPIDLTYHFETFSLVDLFFLLGSSTLKNSAIMPLGAKSDP